MILDFLENKLDSQNFYTNSENQDSNLINLIFDSPIPNNFTYSQIQNEIKPLLNNNNYLSKTSLINSCNIAKELERYKTQTKKTKATNYDFRAKENLFLMKKRGKIFKVEEPEQEQEQCSIKDLDDSNNLKDKLNNEKKPNGRKKKDDLTKREHTKYSDDNIRIKCKHLILDVIMEFINKKIKSIYNGVIGYNILRKELLKVKSEQYSDNTISSSQKLLNRKLSDIFSAKISTKYTIFLPEHNILLIEKLINEVDENKRNYFRKIFNLTFLQCIKHIRGTDFIQELNGIKNIKEIKENLNDESDYKEIIEYYINNYENIINNRKTRKRRKHIKTIT